MKKSKTKLLYNNIHFLIIPILLIGLSFKYLIFLVPLFIYLIYIIRKRILIKPIMILSIIFFFIFVISNNYKTKINNSFKGLVTDKSDTKYTIFSKGEYVLIYSNEDLIPGDIIYVSGTKSDIKKESYSEGFSYYDYLRYQKINNLFYNPKIVKKNHINDINYIRYRILNYYSNKLDSKSFEYINTLVFARNNLESSTKDSISNLGISHLFSISGFHIMLIYMILTFILSKLIKNIYIRDNIIITILLFYLSLTGLKISVLRSVIMIILTILNKRYNKLYTSLDILFSSIFIVLMINPLYLYQTSFHLTYLITFFIIISNDIVKSKSKLKGSLKLSVLAFMSSLPIVVNINGEVNLLAILLTPIFSILVGFLLLPFSFILLIIPIIQKIPIYNIFEYSINILNKISFLTIKIAHINIYLRIIYYLLFILVLIMIESKKVSKKLITVSSMFLLLILNIRVLDIFDRITFIDVGQGDGILISLAHNKGNILIDSYGKNVDYLKYRGIKKLDYVIITHTDNDHVATLSDVVNEFKIKNLYTNPYNELDYKYKVLKSGDILYLKEAKLQVLSPIIEDTNNINNNSIVIRMMIQNISILFTGDIESEGELRLIDKYGSQLRSDVLKVAHHGSNSSSTKEFINLVNPKYSVISLAKNNKYGFPHSSVISNLSKSKIYRTDKNGNVDIIIRDNYFKIKGYRL